MKRPSYTKNQIFRELECRLSVEEAAELCCKHIKTVKEWDKGREIPDCCRRLMRLHTGRIISHRKNWDDFKIVNHHIQTPTGEHISPQQILLAQALLYEQNGQTIQTISKLMRLVRAVAKILVLERR